MRTKPGRLSISAAAAVFSVALLSSCTAFSALLAPRSPGIKIELKEIFTEEIMDATGKGIERKTGKAPAREELYSILEDVCAEHEIVFFAPESRDYEIQEAFVEAAKIRAAEKWGRFALAVKSRESESFMEAVVIETAMALLTVSAGNADPIAEKIEQLAQERETGSEEAYDYSSDIFFEVQELESEAEYLRKARKKLLNLASMIGRNTQEPASQMSGKSAQ